MITDNCTIWVVFLLRLCDCQTLSNGKVLTVFSKSQIGQNVPRRTLTEGFHKFVKMLPILTQLFQVYLYSMFKKNHNFELTKFLVALNAMR